MNTLTKTVTATVLIFATFIPAYAAVAPGIVTDIQAAVGPSNTIDIGVEGDTVTLTGYVADFETMRELERVAKTNGANNVIINVIRPKESGD